jgi:uncharacterized protein YjbI with pentapeptide repeats
MPDEPTISSAIDAARLGPKALDAWRRRMRWDERLDLSGADLAGVNLVGANLGTANLRGTNLRGAVLDHARLHESDLTGAILVQAHLWEVQASQSNWSGANVRHANLSSAQLVSADLSGAQLQSATLVGADLRGADLRRADLSGARLMDANLLEAGLQGATFTRAMFGQTVLAGVDLSSCTGLDSAFHLGPSVVGVDTLVRSRGRAPKGFLSGCGVPEKFIDDLNAVARTVVGYYTCFISYTQRDDAFSLRLYNDLQAAGISCWRWPEDAQWGQEIIREVDQAVRRYDKLVVILSEASLRAPAVLEEVERALEREGREGANVLFPVRLDDAVFSWDHPRKSNLVRKFIGDFSAWQDPESYRTTLKRLIDYLRAADPPQA